MKGAILESWVVKAVVFGLVSFGFIASSAMGQSFRGAIRGQVTDPSGAVIPGARVTVKGTSNGIARAAYWWWYRLRWPCFCSSDPG